MAITIMAPARMVMSTVNIITLVRALAAMRGRDKLIDGRGNSIALRYLSL